LGVAINRSEVVTVNHLQPAAWRRLLSGEPHSFSRQKVGPAAQSTPTQGQKGGNADDRQSLAPPVR
jgi:hypothetical protein